MCAADLLYIYCLKKQHAEKKVSISELMKL